VIVTLAPRSADAVASRTAAIPRDRDKLVRELQKELRRVGCYEGELSGVWTPATRRAMKTFTDRVNATLPIDEPDAVLFAMVQSQPDRVCGKPCPIDQGLGEDGRCLPNAILAKAASKPSPSAVATHAPTSGGPAAGKPAPSRWSATVTAARPTPPAQPAAGAPAAPTPSQALALAPAAPPPTEGRMALANFAAGASRCNDAVRPHSSPRAARRTAAAAVAAEASRAGQRELGSHDECPPLREPELGASLVQKRSRQDETHRACVGDWTRGGRGR
jgi:peptidoglycan hydrolase-like protein with peptidoglycan-binding domain